MGGGDRDEGQLAGRTEMATGEVGLLSSFSSSMRVWAWFSSRVVALVLVRVCMPSEKGGEGEEGGKEGGVERELEDEAASRSLCSELIEIQ